VDEIHTQNVCFCRETLIRIPTFYLVVHLCVLCTSIAYYTKYLIIIDVIIFQNIQILSTLSFDSFIIILCLYIFLHFTTNLKLRVFIIFLKILLRFCIANELLRCQQLLFCEPYKFACHKRICLLGYRKV